MAFRTKFTKNIGTTSIAITDSIPINGKTRTLIGLSVSNTSGSGILADVYINSTNGYSARLNTTAYTLGDFAIVTDTNSDTYIVEVTRVNVAGTSETASPFTALYFSRQTPRTYTLEDAASTPTDGVLWTLIGSTKCFRVKKIPLSAGGSEV